MSFKNKNLDKYVICVMFFLFGVFSIKKTYPLMFSTSEFESGVVVGKNETMTTGKYPKQEFIIAFKYDKPEYGTQDIVTTFHTWNSLQVGQRTAFQYQKTLSADEVAWLLISCIFVLVILGIVVGEIIALLINLWNY